MGKFNMTIKNRLIIAFLAVLVLPAASIGWFSYQTAHNEVAAEIEHSANQSAQSVNSQINDLLTSAQSDMDYLAKTLNIGMADDAGSPEARKALDPVKTVNPQYDNLNYSMKTTAVVFSPEKTMEKGYDPTKRPWYMKSMENKGKAIINDPFVTADDARIVTLMVSKAVEDGSGVVGGTIGLDKLAKQMKTIKVGQKGYVYILDKEHKYLIHPTSKIGDVKKDAYTDQFYAKDSGTVDYELNGVSKRAVFVTNPLTGWKLVATIEMSEVASATRGILVKTLVVMGVAMLIGILLVTWIVRSITNPLKQLMTTTEKIASGDLTEEVAIRSKDELGLLAAAVNDMVHKLRDLIGGVVSSSQSVAAASQQISASTEEIAGGSSAQSQAAQNMQELFSELSTAIHSVACSAEEAAEMAAKTTSIAQDGGKIVQKSVDSMNQVSSQMTQLEEDSTKIGDIIEVIDDIAEQTNLLALNAAIEAARAGEQGRGFAVVADEVRKLAERSGEATKQITAIIKGMQENTHRSVVAVTDGVNQSQQTGQAFEKIIEMINETERKVSDIAAASEEQAAQTGEVMHSIESISTASQEAAAASQETAATSQSLAQLAESLNVSVSAFKVK